MVPDPSAKLQIDACIVLNCSLGCSAPAVISISCSDGGLAATGSVNLQDLSIVKSVVHFCVLHRLSGQGAQAAAAARALLQVHGDGRCSAALGRTPCPTRWQPRLQVCSVGADCLLFASHWPYCWHRTEALRNKDPGVIVFVFPELLYAMCTFLIYLRSIRHYTGVLPSCTRTAGQCQTHGWCAGVRF